MAPRARLRRLSRVGLTAGFVLLGVETVAASGSSPAPPSPETLRQLWVEPRDLESRNLFWGPGGQGSVPRSDVEYRFLELDKTGHSSGYKVEDPAGRRWKVKIGDEAQVEIVVSRVLWAIGYHQPVMHYLPKWRLRGGPTDAPPPGRFRLESDHGKEGEWGWRKNPFAGTQPLHGLLVANLVFNNWDLADNNNRIYRLKKGQGGSTRWYVVQDVGGALGKASFPMGSRNNLEDFESQDLVTAVAAGHVEFDFHSAHAALLDDVAPADVVWACRLISRLRDRQLADAFRAAQYPSEVSARYIAKIRAKLKQGLALATPSGSMK